MLYSGEAEELEDILQRLLLLLPVKASPLLLVVVDWEAEDFPEDLVEAELPELVVLPLLEVVVDILESLQVV